MTTTELVGWAILIGGVIAVFIVSFSGVLNYD